MKKIAILQSNYVPWKGYFDLIAAVDEFIVYDDVQFTKNDWRNRNIIKTPQGLQWLTVPVGQKINRRIRDVSLNCKDWQQKHWRTLEGNYKRAKHFQEVSTLVKPLYEINYQTLTDLNVTFIRAICHYLGIQTKISFSWDYRLSEGKTDRLVDLCLQAGGSLYVSGPAAKSYLCEDLFLAKGISLTWFDYEGYTIYPQLWGDFTHNVSILDLLFNCGKESYRYLRYTDK